MSKGVHADTKHNFNKIGGAKKPVDVPAPAAAEAKPEEPQAATPAPVAAEPKPEEPKVATTTSAQAVAPVVTAVEKKSEEASPATRFELMLNTLNEMGFVDRAKNLDTLVRHRGNLSAAIQQLLNN